MKLRVSRGRPDLCQTLHTKANATNNSCGHGTTTPSLRSIRRRASCSPASHLDVRSVLDAIIAWPQRTKICVLMQVEQLTRQRSRFRHHPQMWRSCVEGAFLPLASTLELPQFQTRTSYQSQGWCSSAASLDAVLFLSP